MQAGDDSLSVLVVDEEPEILSFFARVLDAGGMRALLARGPGEAIAISKLGYVPIDLVLTNVFLKPDATAPDVRSGTELVDCLRELRPGIRALLMSANVDPEVIRIEFLDRGGWAAWKSSVDRGLIESIRAAAAGPQVHRVGGIFQ